MRKVHIPFAYFIFFNSHPTNWAARHSLAPSGEPSAYASMRSHTNMEKPYTSQVFPCWCDRRKTKEKAVLNQRTLPSLALAREAPFASPFVSVRAGRLSAANSGGLLAANRTTRIVCEGGRGSVAYSAGLKTRFRSFERLESTCGAVPLAPLA